jgi:hypothetical protein
MEFTASVVDWELVRKLKADGGLDDAILECEPEIEIADTPWPSDSARVHIAAAGAVSSNPCVAAVLNEDFVLPQDLGADLDPELVAGSLNPESVEGLLPVFNSFDASALTRDTREYMAQWAAMLEYAKSKRAGVLFHLG